MSMDLNIGLFDEDSDSGFFGAVLSGLNGLVEHVLENGLEPFAEASSPYFYSFLVLFFIGYGTALQFGRINKSISEMAWDFIVASVVAVLFGNFDVWFPYAVYLLLAWPSELIISVISKIGLGGGLFNDSTISPGNALDKMVFLSSTLFERETAEITIGVRETNLNMANVILSGINMLVTVAFVFLALSVLARSVIMITVLLIPTPIFLAFYYAGFTRNMLNTWIQQLVNYAIAPFFTYLILVVVVSIEVPQSAGQSYSFFLFLIAAAIKVIGLTLLKEVPGLAQSIAGGLSLSGSSGVGQQTARAASAIAKALPKRSNSIVQNKAG